MSLEPTLFRRWRTPLIAFLWSVVTLLSVSAEDTATPSASSAPQANQAPGFSNQAPAVGLRQPESPDPSSVTSTSSGAAAPAPTDTASPDLAPPPKVDGLPPAAPATPSENVTINLIHLMVAKGLITKDDAANLIKQAEQEADTARAQAAATQATAERALTAQANQPAPAPAPAPSGDDEVRIAYVPDVVKNQIRDEVTQSVEKKARDEHWADKDTTPDWVKRFHVSGDIRLRYQGDLYPTGNAVGNFPNFNAINTGSGLNFNTGTPVLPQYDVDQDRNRFRFRARIGADIDLSNNFTSGLRLASGSDNSPVTGNQTFGAANSGQGGNFSKYSIWLDRAFLKYQLGGQADKDLTITLGRFDNPFFSSSMIWSKDLGFDGAVVQAKYKVADGVTPFLTAGAFPVFNTDLNFSSNQSVKYGSEDKYLYAAQFGTNWKINDDFNAKVAVAYYDFEDIQGKVSDPILIASANESGTTDDSRPSFAQNGNTYIALRDFEDPAPGGNPENQYFGLATPFHDFAATARLDFNHFDPFHIAIVGEFVENVAFDRNDIINNGPVSQPGPVNNLRDGGDPTSFVGGNIGWNVNLNLGKVALEQLWDWNLTLTYRYVQSDATVDGFTDSDFGGSLAGTNLQGYIIGGNLALSPRVWTSVQWMSSDAIAGPTYKNDLIQVDINAKF